MNIIRKLKISKLVNVEFTDMENNLLEFINDKLSNLSVYHSQKHHYSTFYMSQTGEYVLEEIRDTEIVHVNYRNIWSVLEREYGMNRDKIVHFLKYMIEVNLKHETYTPAESKSHKRSEIEAEYSFLMAT